MSEEHPQGDADSRFELKTLLETSRMLVESHDMDFVLNNLLLISMGKLMISRAVILIYQPAIDTYLVSKSKGSECLSEGVSYNPNGAASLREQSVVQNSQENWDLSEVLGTVCGLSFNLRTSNEHIGFLCLGSKSNGQDFTEREIEFVESLSIISSGAIANSRMFNELRKTNRLLDRKVYDLNTLFDLSKDFNVMVDRQEIVRVFKFALLGQMLVRKFFFLYDNQGSRELLSSSGIEDHINGQQIDWLFDRDQDVVEVDEELAGQMPLLKENGIKALISLNVQQEKVAVVGVGAPANEEKFSASDYNFLQSLANLAVLSIQKTYLLEERIEKERLEEELSIAKSIQKGLLPDPIPDCDQLDIAAQNRSSHQVGGDYFDILETPNEHLLFAIGDVTGKGTPAALLMANLQAMLHVLLPTDISLSEATGQINDIIHRNTPSDKFITFFWSIYNPERSELSFVNAGHNAPLLIREGSEKVHKLEDGGLILGAMPTAAAYAEQKVQVHSGDLLVFYTDGVTEAQNKAGDEEFGRDRLINCIKENREDTAQQIQQSIIEEVAGFSGEIQRDDLTLIVIKAC